MGAPLGNQNAASAKRWAAAVERATARLATGQKTDPNDDRSDFVKGLDQLADAFVARAVDGVPFFKEYADRMDGKAAQSVTLSGNPDAPLVTSVTVNFPKTEKPEGS